MASSTSGMSKFANAEERKITFGEGTTVKDVQEALQCGTHYDTIEFIQCSELPEDEFHEVFPMVNKDLQTLIIVKTPWINDETMELFTAYCHKIKKFHMIGRLSKITRVGIESIGRNCSEIESVSIIFTDDDDDDKCGSSVNEKKHKWTLDNQIFPALINNSSARIKHFALCGFTSITFDALRKFLDHLKNSLISLDFSNLSIIDDSALEQIGRQCRILLSFKVNNCPKISHHGVIALVSQGLMLHDLEVAGSEHLTDDATNAVANHCPTLKSIKLDYGIKLTETSLRILAQHCKDLVRISMRGTGIRVIPLEIAKLPKLVELNVSGCKELNFPSPHIIEEGLDAIIENLLECNITKRVRIMFVGSQQSGKSSIIMSLQSLTGNVADCQTLGIPVRTWLPFKDRKSGVPKALKKAIERTPTTEETGLSLEIWDCSGRKALQGIHPLFMGPRSLYVVCFNVSMRSSIEKVYEWVNTIQAKNPGVPIIIVASHKDLAKDETTLKATCSEVMTRLKEMEIEKVRRIKQNLESIQDLHDEGLVKSRKETLRMMLEHRPIIHGQVVAISSINEQGIADLRKLLVEKALNTDLFPAYNLNKGSEQLCVELLRLRQQSLIVQTLTDFKRRAKYVGIENEAVLKKIMEDLNMVGCIMSFNYPRHLTPDNEQIICIDPASLANTMAGIYRNEDNPQDLVNLLQRGGHVDTFWPNAKPNDWTLRGAFNNITHSGMIRETIIPLLLHLSLIHQGQLDEYQAKLLIKVMEWLVILVSGAPNASYDVELILTNYKNLSVYKRYFMPFQGKLPVIPQVNAWLPTCPETQLEIGWRFRFFKPIAHSFFISLVSASMMALKSSETLSYWQFGTYLRVGEVDISVVQDEKNLAVDIMARPRHVKGHNRQAYNMGWCFLGRYLYVIQTILCTYPAMFYEVFVYNAKQEQWKPLYLVTEAYIKGAISRDLALRMIPVPTEDKVGQKSRIPPDMSDWLMDCSAHCVIYINYCSEHYNEVRCLLYHIESAGYVCVCQHEIVEDKRNECFERAGLILLLLTNKYLEERNFDTVKLALEKSKKVVVATLEIVNDLEQHELYSLIEKLPRIDITEGTGSGANYQVNKPQAKSLVEACHITLFDTGDLEEVSHQHDQDRKFQVNHSSYGQSGAQKKRSVHFSEIAKLTGPMNEEEETHRVAASAVAAAVAAATAEHVAKQSNPTMGAKAAAMASKVGAAVAKGDSDAAAKAVIATAQAVDEVVALASSRTPAASSQADANGTVANKEANLPPKSATCAIL
eukprot:gene6311-7033_t